MSKVLCIAYRAIANLRHYAGLLPRAVFHHFRTRAYFLAERHFQNPIDTSYT